MSYPNTYTAASLEALRNLRTGDGFQWSIIPIFALVAFAYFNEAQHKNWNVILAGLGGYALEWLSEIGNALILPLSGRSALWTTPSKSSCVLLVGINVEITLMFALAGLAFAKLLPADRNARLGRFSARAVLVVAYATLGVTIEVLLNRAGVLVWEYEYWNWPHVWSIFLCAYAPFMAFCFWLYDLKSYRNKLIVVASLVAADIAGFAIFGQYLHMI